MKTKDSPGPPWTILTTLKWTSDYFKAHNIESPRVDAELLLAHGLRCRRIDLYLRYDQPLDQDELSGLRELIKRRVDREPVAYIVGQKEFWSLNFFVNPSVLIPRPETEGLVEAALEYLPVADQSNKTPFPMRTILELGTGSGAIITSLASERPQYSFWATDVSPAALEVARCNARQHLPDNEIRFMAGQWFAPLSSIKGRFDLILSNPPYIPADAIGSLEAEIQSYEPHQALDGGPDGLRDIVHLVWRAPDHLKAGGVLLLEIGHNQGAAVARHGQQVGRYDPIEVRKDNAGLDRIVCLHKKSGY